MDIRPPKKRSQAAPSGQPSAPRPPVTPPPPRVQSPQTPLAVMPTIAATGPEEPPRPQRKSKAKWIIGSLMLLLVVLASSLLVAYNWYQSQLQPRGSEDADRVRVTIESGMTPDMIGRLLEEKAVIRSSLAFDIYTRLQGNAVRGGLQAGTYNLSPADSTPEVVTHILQGKTDQFSVTFLPGATITDHKKVLIQAGYSEQEVEAAFAKQYDHPVFAGKPTTADLEGYIYGETYSFTSDTSVEAILERTFDELWTVVGQNNLIEAYSAQNLTLYQGLTLASIIQREVSGASDQKQVSQIFLRRLSIGMPLGADATFVYAAKKLGVQPSVDLQSPYNTRQVTGLPPGPIASPGKSALLATASPAEGDYLYFVSGDDGTNYFSRTLEEHEANTRTYCQKNCSLF